MRYVVGLACVLSLSVASPSGARAQAEQNGTAAEPNAETPLQSSEPTRSWLERSHPEAFVDPTKPKPGSEPALQLGVDSAGLQVTPTAPLSVEEFELQEIDDRVQRAKIGVGVSAIPIGVGAIMASASAFASINSFDLGSTQDTSSQDTALYAGSAIAGVGGVSMIATGILLGVRKHQRRRFQEAQPGTARRVQWDTEASRLVF